MGLEHFNIVHVALPILDVASVVPGHHPYVVVGPHHCSHRAVVCLKKYEDKYSHYIEIEMIIVGQPNLIKI